MSTKRVLFIGEHPLSMSGNGAMMEALLSKVNHKEYTPVCFAFESTLVDPIMLVPKPIPFSIIPSPHFKRGGHSKLLSILRRVEFDAVVFVGIDIWEYNEIRKDIQAILRPKNTPWISIFPYDIQMLRKDWVDWIRHFDYPCVYSKYGFNLLKEEVPNIQYFRPPLQGAGLWRKFDEEEREVSRKKYFPIINEDTFLFGFIGSNQIRKDPQLLIQAYSIVKKELPEKDIRLYTHMDINSHFNLKQYALDCGIKSNELLAKKSGTQTALIGMVNLYNSLDCLVNCSLQEGLSWTLVEAMLCGVPFIASETTAQIELLETAGFRVPCEHPTYLPLFGNEGHTWIDAKRCKVEDVAQAMIDVAESEDLRKELSLQGLKAGKEWLEDVSDINKLINEACKPKVIIVQSIREAILFAQHSSAGDVLMTTQCFKGIKEKHPDLPLVYMTSEQFINIVEGNPYIDEIISWDESKLRSAFKVVYNPHGEKILNGRFNTLNTKLYEMYPYFCKVDPDVMFIYMEDIRKDLREQIEDLGDYILVHTTGGADSRIYKHMDMVVSNFKGYEVVQVGSNLDLTCHKTTLDLRGKLTWREAAHVMFHASAAVVIDSYPAHLAGAMDTPAVVLFGPAPARVTAPRSDKVQIICLEPNHLDVCPQMGFCYGAECSSPCINTISPMRVRSELQKLLKSNEVQSRKEGEV